MSVVLNPTFQIARLADIEPVAPAVEHAIDARLRWHRPKCLADHSSTGSDPSRRCLDRGGIVSPQHILSFRHPRRTGNGPRSAAGVHRRALASLYRAAFR